MTDIRFRLQIAGGNMRMIKRDVFEYFKKEPDVMQVKDLVRLLHCSKNTVYKLIHEGRLDTVKIGRSILIPKKIRRILRIREGDPLHTILTSFDCFIRGIVDFAERITGK